MPDPRADRGPGWILYALNPSALSCNASSTNPAGLNTEPSAAKQLDARNAYGAPGPDNEKEIADQIFDAAVSISRVA